MFGNCNHVKSCWFLYIMLISHKNCHWIMSDCECVLCTWAYGTTSNRQFLFIYFFWGGEGRGLFKERVSLIWLCKRRFALKNFVMGSWGEGENKHLKDRIGIKPCMNSILINWLGGFGGIFRGSMACMQQTRIKKLTWIQGQKC